MQSQHFIALIEINSENLNELTGALIVQKMGDLKKLINLDGSCEYYHVTDVKALSRFKSEIKRLNP
jgi:hypothetical protein